MLRTQRLGRNSENVPSVMPAQAGIQEDEARASGYAAWIPGLALLARNDGLPCLYGAG